MGGPFWARKDEGAWSIPKGEFENEAPLDAALREVKEETDLEPKGTFLELSPVKQSGGKIVFAWAVEWDCDPTQIKSNTFTLEWPKGSGKMREFPEVDRATWFPLAEARSKILKGQLPLLSEFEGKLA
jgi:predicted NUDIX family NTP pyrophosphohydrolase